MRDTPPRDVAAVAANTVQAARILRSRRPMAIVSTGAGIALSFCPLGRARGVDCHYIESSARSQSPSLTGRLLRRLPGMRLYTQYPEWAEGPWRYAGSVFDGFVAAERPRAPIRRVVVTVGTIGYPFRRLIDRVSGRAAKGRGRALADGDRRRLRPPADRERTTPRARAQGRRSVRPTW